MNNDAVKQRMEIPPTCFVRMENNIPIPVYTAIPTAGTIRDMHYAALASRYDPDIGPDGEPLPNEAKFIGWTCLEVMAYKRAQAAAHGDIDSHKFMLDRTLGKAVVQINQTNVNITLGQALDDIADAIELANPGLIGYDKSASNTIDVSEVQHQMSDVW